MWRVYYIIFKIIFITRNLDIIFNYFYNYFNKLSGNNLYKYENNPVAIFIEELKLKIIL